MRRRRPLPSLATLGLLGLLPIVLPVASPLPWSLSLLSLAPMGAALLVLARARRAPLDVDDAAELLAVVVRRQGESEMSQL